MRAKKRFGQHFLEPAWVARLIDRLDAQPTDTFLEIGPGRGALTLPLAGRVGRMVAVEIDRDLAAQLQDRVPSHVRIVERDFLAVDIESVMREALPAISAEPIRWPIRVVGNLPYNVASPILFKLLAEAGDGRRLADATLMVQKEVADRIAAAPGDDAYGGLAIQVGLLADVERLLVLPPGAFRPPPKVTSAVIRLRFRPAAEDVGDRQVFERIVRGVFLQRRKTLANALRPVADALARSAPDLIARAAIDPRRRPETLTLAEYARLSRAVL